MRDFKRLIAPGGVSPLKAQFDCRNLSLFGGPVQGSTLIGWHLLWLLQIGLTTIFILCLEGSHLLGQLSPSHIFRPAVVEPLVTLEELLVFEEDMAPLKM